MKSSDISESYRQNFIKINPQSDSHTVNSSSLSFKDGIRQYRKHLLLCFQFLLCRQKKKENKVRSVQKDKM